MDNILNRQKSMTSKNTLKMFVRGRLAILRISIAEAERRGNLSRGFIGDILRDQKKSVHGVHLTGLARALEVRPNQILEASGAGGETNYSEAIVAPADGTPEIDFSALATVFELPMRVREISEIRSAIEGGEVRSWWVIPSNYLRERDTKYECTFIVRVQDDAMEPEVMRTDAVLIDFSRRTIDGSGIWLINIGGGPLLRRISPAPPAEGGQPLIRIQTSNPRYPEEVRPAAEVFALGRMIGRFTIF